MKGFLISFLFSFLLHLPLSTPFGVEALGSAYIAVEGRTTKRMEKGFKRISHFKHFFPKDWGGGGLSSINCVRCVAIDFTFYFLFCLLNVLPWLVVVGVVRCWRDWVVAVKGDSPGAVKGRSTQCPYRALDGVRCWPHRNFQFSIATNKSNNKTQNQNKSPRPFSLPNTSDDGRKNNNENCLGLLLCCRLFLWCHRIIILLDGYQHSTVTTHTHTHTGERAWHAPFTGRRGQGQPTERHTHTHTLHQWKRYATTVRSVTTFWQFLFKLFLFLFRREEL